MARPLSRRPIDLERCGRCKRLGQRTNMVKIAGQWYGPECYVAVQEAATELEEHLLRTKEGRDEDG